MEKLMTCQQAQRRSNEGDLSAIPTLRSVCARWARPLISSDTSCSQLRSEQKVIDRHLPICYGRHIHVHLTTLKVSAFRQGIIPGCYVPVECHRSCIGGALDIGTLLSRHARYRPQHVAVVCGGQHLTFQAFNRRVNHLAQR